MPRTSIALAAAVLSLPLGASAAFAQSALNGAPPPEEKALVTAPAAPGAVPTIAKPATDGTTVTLSAGGQLATGNSNLLAGSVNGSIDHRKGFNEFGFFLLGSYGQSTPVGGQWAVETVGNIQGKIRYDRYLSDPAALFLIVTGRNDKFQGLDFRLNLDPGFKYLFLTESTNALWLEAGYDFQFDARRADSLGISAPTGAGGALEPVPVAGCTPTDPNFAVDGNIAPCTQADLDKTQIYHSARVFAGFRHAFNKDVTLGAGVEYLQSLVAVNAGAAGNVYDSRLNIDALFASKISGGLSLGVGFHAAYDHYPLPGKHDLDTQSTLTLIYSFSDIPGAASAALPVPGLPSPSAPTTSAHGGTARGPRASAPCRDRAACPDDRAARGPGAQPVTHAARRRRRRRAAASRATRPARDHATRLCAR